MLLIEGRDERFVNEVGEQNSLWYRVGVQRRRLRCRKSASFNGFLRRRGRLCFYDISLREFSRLKGTIRPPMDLKCVLRVGSSDLPGRQISLLIKRHSSSDLNAGSFMRGASSRRYMVVR